MTRNAWLGIPCLFAAIGLTACEQPANQSQARSTDAAPPAAPARHSDAPQGVDWFEGSVAAAFEQASDENKPVLLYWGAVWCPYCQDLKAYVFSRRDVQEKLKLFVPVYLDGDDAGAQKWGEEFGIAGYPTVLALRPDRTELARIAGGMDVSVYANMLDLVLGDVRPLEDLLAGLQQGSGALPSEDCARLAYNGWGLDDYPTAADERRIATQLARAAEHCPADARVERARLTAIAAGYASDAAAEAVQAGRPPEPQLVQSVHGTEQILADPQLAASVADALQYLGEDFFVVAKHADPAATKQLLENWSAAMDAVANDSRYTEGDRLAAIDGKLTAVKALSPGAAIPPALAADAKQRIDNAFARVKHSPARAGLVNAAINLLVTLDDPERAYAIAENETKTSKTPYYYMGDMAALDEMMGRKDAAVRWFERAYDESRGPATRFQWGTDYVRGLIRLRPDDEASIRGAAIEVLGELDGPDRIYRRSRGRLKSLDASLREWNADGTHEATMTAIRARMSDICAAIPTSEPGALKSCRTFLAAGRESPPASG